MQAEQPKPALSVRHRAANLLNEAANALECTIEVSAAADVTPDVWECADQALRRAGLAFGPVFEQNLAELGTPRVGEIRRVAEDLRRMARQEALTVTLRQTAESVLVVAQRVAAGQTCTHIPPRSGDDDLVLAGARNVLLDAADQLQLLAKEIGGRDAELAELRETLRLAKTCLAAYENGRCGVCDWPLASDKGGCSPGNCSFRCFDDRLPEKVLLDRRREFLAKLREELRSGRGIVAMAEAGGST